jgi:hypothetical protein
MSHKTFWVSVDRRHRKHLLVAMVDGTLNIDSFVITLRIPYYNFASCLPFGDNKSSDEDSARLKALKVEGLR